MARLASASTEGVSGDAVASTWKRILSEHVARDDRDADSRRVIFEPVDRSRFKGCIEYGDLGDAAFCKMASSSHRYIRDPGLGDGAAPTTLVVLQTRGTCYFEQGTRRNCLEPGDWNVYDTTRPFSIVSAGWCEHLLLLPRDGTAHSLRDALGQMPDRSFGRDGVERTVRDLMSSAFRECPKMGLRSGEATVASILQLVRASVEQANVAADSPTATSRSRILGFIEANLADDDLSVSMVAETFGCSTRQIHRMFQDEAGMTVSEYIWKRRLEHSLEDLRSADNQGRTITDIAFSWGFCSAAHFSRAFKEAYGITPRQCRHVHAG